MDRKEKESDGQGGIEKKGRKQRRKETDEKGRIETIRVL